MSQKSLGEFEHIVLLALIRLEGNAYGASIRQFLHSEIDRNVALGALYSTLERMEKKGLVVSVLGEATAQRGGRPKRFFSVTAEGKAALRHAKQVIDTMWKDVAVKASGESYAF
ncbi:MULTISPECIES: PadR family transcriptional regulator [Gammaproteobacteria]|uniref:PadR family transcriptional regulator n=1 Tax=Gammaproteobacteria TaxID=1236 RepID=UPI000DD0C023|nr:MULTISPECIES: PadR family transcriptional regulator [Gammaproteobacteria]RTE85497.1 PadR family transcriptional regulator [Aliidiomarina sp. B3213]TCZ89466.1 PadR family transcriptional regulator [Lysobacter sp. N42]